MDRADEITRAAGAHGLPHVHQTGMSERKSRRALTQHRAPSTQGSGSAYKDQSTSSPSSRSQHRWVIAVVAVVCMFLGLIIRQALRARASSTSDVVPVDPNASDAAKEVDFITITVNHNTQECNTQQEGVSCFPLMVVWNPHNEESREYFTLARVDDPFKTRLKPESAEISQSSESPCIFAADSLPGAVSLTPHDSDPDILSNPVVDCASYKGCKKEYHASTSGFPEL